MGQPTQGETARGAGGKRDKGSRGIDRNGKMGGQSQTRKEGKDCEGWRKLL